MSYLNNQVGYRDELLMTRSVVKKENYVLLEPDGLVKMQSRDMRTVMLRSLDLRQWGLLLQIIW